MTQRSGSLHGFKQDPYREGKKFDDSHLKDRGWDDTVYDYQLADGLIIYQQCRYDKVRLWPGEDAPKKRFLPRRPVDPKKPTEFVFGPGERRVIYRWPEIMRAGPGATVFVCEGEKNADDVARSGLLATTVISHKWTPECAAALSGYHLIILEDHDDDGKKLSAAAHKELVKVAKSICVVPTAHLWKHLDPAKLKFAKEPPLNADVSDWLYYGGDPSKLIEICREIPTNAEISAEPYDFPDERDIEVYYWLLGYHLLRGEVVGTAALSGTGKSSLAIVEALAMASGKSLLYDQVPKIPLKVMLINLEDNRNTMEKRIAAAMRHHKLTKADIEDRLVVKAKGQIKVKVAETTRNGQVVRNEPIIKALIDVVLKNQIDVVSIDSFIRSHGVSENNNNEIEQVIECFEEIATATNCGVHLWHHVRKGNGEGASVDSARGAKALVDALRSVRILEPMAKEEARQLKLAESGSYFRSFSGKRNFAPPSDKSHWFHLANVEIDNNSPLFGEEIGVVEKWAYPAKLGSDISPAVIAKIMAEVGHKPVWRADPRAAMWVGKAVARVVALDAEDDAARIKVTLKELRKLHALEEVTGLDEARRQKTFVVAGEWVPPMGTYP
jgi:hypothetical protein